LICQLSFFAGDGRSVAEEINVKVIPVLSDLDLELKSECKGVQGLKGLRSGVEN
jgi:hypothetical protein